MLAIAATACVTMLLGAVIPGDKSQSGALDLRHITLIALVAGAGFIAGLIVWHMTSSARREARDAKAEVQQLRRNLASADAIIRVMPSYEGQLRRGTDPPARCVHQVAQGNAVRGSST